MKRTFFDFTNNSFVEYFLFVLGSIILLMTFAVLSPETAKAAAFTCDSSFYQTINGTLTELNPQSGQYTTIGFTGSFNTNATGYNVEDNFIYGMQVIDGFGGGSNGLVRIEDDGSATGLGIPTGLPWPGSYVSGDFDLSGNLYVSTANSTLYRIDVSANTATSVVLTSSLPVNDIVFANGLLYGLSSTTLYEINPSSGVVVAKSISITADSGNPTSVYGAGWAADSSKLFFSRNSDGKIFEISGFTGASPTAAVVLDGDSATGNDGAGCSLGGSPIPPFVVMDDSGTSKKDTPLYVPASQGLLVNDSGRQTTITSYTQPTNGTVVVNPDGSYTYTPNPGFVGTDTFTYTVTDEYGVTETATATITITDSASATLAATGISQSSLFIVVISIILLAQVFMRLAKRYQ